jgi:hypothetical protein
MHWMKLVQCHMQPGCNIVEALSTSRMRWYDLRYLYTRKALTVHNCIVNQMPGLKNERKNLKWHLHKLKILEAWDQFSWKRMTQIITLHCLCNPFRRLLSLWQGSTSWKFYTVQTMELWTFRSIKQWAQVWYKASKSMGKKTNHFA